MAGATNESTTKSTQANIELLIQPGSSIARILNGIDEAQETIHIAVFRFDRREIEMALKRAARRGVFVHALVAHTSAGQGGEITLRKLEMGLLADGITVTRTAGDLVRYHNKMMIVDHKTLYLLGFNYTYLDIERSRSFGVITTVREWVDEAEKLFMADATRQQYTPECPTFVVSPGNSRRELARLLASAKRQLLIYDDKLSDPDVMRLLAQKVRAGLDVRVIGTVGKRALGVIAARLQMRLHAQIIICDGECMFLGSQSLRSLELDARREAGILVDDPHVIRAVADTFESDWQEITGARRTELDPKVIAKIPEEDEKEVLQAAITPAITPESSAELIKQAVKEAIKDAVMDSIEPAGNSLPLKEAIKEAAKEALRELAS